MALKKEQQTKTETADAATQSTGTEGVERRRRNNKQENKSEGRQPGEGMRNGRLAKQCTSREKRKPVWEGETGDSKEIPNIQKKKQQIKNQTAKQSRTAHNKSTQN